MRLLKADVEDHPAITLDPVHQTEGRVAQLPVLQYVRRGVEGSALLLPLIGWDAIAVDLELKEIALQLVEPGRKSPDLAGWQHKPTQPEDGAGVVLRMLPAHERADVAELIQVRDVVNTDPQKRESPHFRTGLGIRAPAARLERLRRSIREVRDGSNEGGQVVT